MTAYDDSLTLRDARGRYFRDNAFGDDGGYAKKWVTLKLGPLPFAFPNSEARVRAVKWHDLHHVVTGYGTDIVGEAEIGAWEIGSGCAGFVAAWILNFYAMALGFVSGHPGALWRAFLCGRQTRNLYRTRYDDRLLDTPLGALRVQLGFARDGAAVGGATLGDRASFTGYCAAALALLLATSVLLLAPFFFVIRALA